MLCGTSLPIVKVWWVAKTLPRLGLCLLRKTGVSCPSCGTPYIIVQKRAVVAGTVIFFGGVVAYSSALVALGKVFDDTQSFFLGLPLVFLVVWAQMRIAPLFAQVRIAFNNETADFPLSKYRRASI
jgi:hypothetical protein